MTGKYPKLLREGAKICERAELLNLRQTLLDAANYIEGIETEDAKEAETQSDGGGEHG